MSQFDELPEGWVETTLGDVTLPFETAQPQKDPDREFVYIDIGSIDNSTQKIFEPKRLLGKDAPSRARRIVKSGDVLFSTVRTYLKNIARVTENLDGVLTSTGIAILRAAPGVDKDYIFHIVTSEDFIREISRTMDGTLYPAVTDGDVNSAIIPLPPLNEQRRIVEKIEALTARSRKARAALDEIPGLLDQFRQSVLAAAFRGDLTADWRAQNPDVEPMSERIKQVSEIRLQDYEDQCFKAREKGFKKPRKPENVNPQERSFAYNVKTPETWIKLTLRDISSTKKYSMSSGPFGSALGKKDYVTEGIPVVRGQNIQGGNFISKNFVCVSESKAEELSRSVTRPNDIVIVAVGAGAGNSALVPQSIELAVLSQNCNKFTLDSSLVEPEFILFNLQIQISKDQMHDSTTDTARQFLSLTNLKEISFPIPPLEEQKKINEKIRGLLKIADQVEQYLQIAMSDSNELDRSILAKAFRGELVPQDPNDEPAAVLLDRIRAERERLGSGKKRGKAKA